MYLIVSEDEANYWFSRAEDKTFHNCQVTWKREAMTSQKRKEKKNHMKPTFIYFSAYFHSWKKNLGT